MKSSPIGELDYALAWFLFFVCSTIGGMLAGFVAGVAVGIVLGIAGVGPDVIRIICFILGFLISIPVSYLTFRVFVGKFIVGKIQEKASPTEPHPSAPSLP